MYFRRKVENLNDKLSFLDIADKSKKNEDVKCNGKQRWKKTEDKNLWNAFERVMNQQGIELEDFLNSNKIKKNHSIVLKIVKKEISWKGTIYVLRKRILKIYNASRFTSRDIRKLKKLLKEVKNRIKNYWAVTNIFPRENIRTNKRI